jgi:hypothetical protein
MPPPRIEQQPGKVEMMRPRRYNREKWKELTGETDALLIEECLFDHNGWSETIANAESASDVELWSIEDGAHVPTFNDSFVPAVMPAPACAP